MRRSAFLWWMVALLAVPTLILSACAAPPDDAVVVGVVIHVDGDLDSVDSFTIVTDDAEQLTFVPDPEQGNPRFALQHLPDHLRSGAPVEVRFEERDGVRYATWVDDAAGGH